MTKGQSPLYLSPSLSLSRFSFSLLSSGARCRNWAQAASSMLNAPSDSGGEGEGFPRVRGSWQDFVARSICRSCRDGREERDSIFFVTSDHVWGWLFSMLCYEASCASSPPPPTIDWLTDLFLSCFFFIKRTVSSEEQVYIQSTRKKSIVHLGFLNFHWLVLGLADVRIITFLVTS